jgi:hypothetical protein
MERERIRRIYRRGRKEKLIFLDAMAINDEGRPFLPSVADDQPSNMA